MQRTSLQRMRILVLSGIPGEEEDMMRTGQHGSYHTHSSGSHSLRDQDPVIEEVLHMCMYILYMYT